MARSARNGAKKGDRMAFFMVFARFSGVRLGPAPRPAPRRRRAAAHAEGLRARRVAARATLAAARPRHEPAASRRQRPDDHGPARSPLGGGPVTN